MISLAIMLHLFTATTAESVGVALASTPLSLIGLGRNATCNIRLGANCHKADLNLSKKFDVVSVDECCNACQVEPRCKAFTVDRRRRPVAGKLGECYLKTSCDGLLPDDEGISGVMSDGKPFPLAQCQYPDKTFINCSAASFMMMCAALDQPGCCHWCGSTAAGSCYPNRTACPTVERRLVHGAASELVVTPELFGAVGDGRSNDWLPIKQALAACSTAVYNTSARRSCRVLFSKSYLSGPLILNSSFTTVEVATGATLAMLPKSDYEKACPQTGCPFISTGEPSEGCRTVYPNPHSPSSGYKVCLRDVTVTGGGTIDGNANWEPSSWWLCARLQLSFCGWRPVLTFFEGVEGLTVNGSLTFKNGPTGFMRLYSNVGTRVSGLTLNAPYFSRNTDGINVYGGFDTLLENAVVDNGDDCVSIVPTGEWIDQGNFCFQDPGNVLCSGGHAIVRNFTCNGGHGLSIGGIRHGTVSNVTFSNITATGGQKGSTQDEQAGGGCRIKSRPNSTGSVFHIRYEDMVFKDVYWPLQLLGHYCPFPCGTPDGNTTTLFSNISFERVRGRSSQRSLLPYTKTTVVQFKCTAYTPCANITLREVTLTDKEGHTGLLDCENVASVSIDNASSPGACDSQWVII